ncbi:MAG: hypothetical protein WD358_08615 [Nitriliruptoraceae bacterium]
MTPQPPPVTRGLSTQEGGFVAGAEALLFGVLIFVLGTLMVVNAWAVIDARLAASAAAREAVRAVVEAPPGTNLEVLASRAARDAVQAHGRDPSTVRIESTGPLVQSRCARVRLRVSVPIVTIAVPGVTSRSPGAAQAPLGHRWFEATSTYSEVVDPYRSGLPGTAVCPW